MREQWYQLSYGVRIAIALAVIVALLALCGCILLGAAILSRPEVWLG